MKLIEKHPMIMILVGILGISLSSIFVRYSTAPSPVTAAWRLCWTVVLMTPVVLGKKEIRAELFRVSRKNLILSILSGLFLAAHFALWFESLYHTTVASSTTIVCTEVIWVSIGFCLFLKGKLHPKALAAIAITIVGSLLIAWSDSASGSGHLYGDILALLAAIAVAIYTLIGQIVRKELSTSIYTYILYIACALSLLALCATLGNSLADTLFGFGPSPIVIGALLALFSTILGHSIFSWCLKYFSPSFVSASKLCEPVAAAVLASILFGEIPTLLQILGCALILGGVLYYSHLERGKA